MQTLKGHIGWVNSVDISPNAKIIASVGKDGLVKLWSLSGHELKSLQGHRGEILGVKFASDNKSLISVGVDSSIIMWSMDLEDLLEQGCKWVNNYLRNNPLVSPNDKHLCDNITH